MGSTKFLFLAFAAVTKEIYQPLVHVFEHNLLKYDKYVLKSAFNTKTDEKNWKDLPYLLDK